MTTRHHLYKALAACALTLAATTAAHAEIVQDCVLEGVVDKERAAALGRPVFLSFRSIARGSEAPCDMARQNNSRRVQFRTPAESGIDEMPHGATVRYRYIKRADGSGEWQLLDAAHRGRQS
jgi:hypothetical protein